MRADKSSKKGISRLFRNVPLRAALIVPFVVQVVVVVGLVGYISFRNGQKAVNDMASQLRTEMMNRTEDYISVYLKVPHQVNQINAAAIRQGTLDVQDVPAIEHHFWQQIQIFDTVSYLSFGNIRGEFIGIEYMGAGTLHVEVKDIDVTGEDLHTYVMDDQGERTALRLGVVEGYDATVRPWYQAAVQAGEPTWSGVYQFSSREVVRLGITAVQPAYDKAGQFIGVLAADIVLSQLNDFLASLEIGVSGQSFIIEQDGLLVGSSTGGQPAIIDSNNEARRIQATESSDMLISATAHYLTDMFHDFTAITERQQVDFSLEGKRQFVQVLPFSDGRGIEWLIVVVVPEADFMEQIQANSRITLWLSLLALLVAIVIGIFTSAWITRPILRLNRAAKEIADGQWSQPIHTDRTDEFGELAHSFNSMAHQLREWFKTLELHVEERTAELVQRSTQLAVANAEMEKSNDRLKSEIEKRIQTEAKLQELAITDSLTEIYNRRHFLDLAEKELIRSIRYQRNFSFILIDLDNLKTINDKHGHLSGDRVLQEVAKSIRQNSRDVDIFGRYGGDEFIVLLPETDESFAQIYAERLCQKTSAQLEELEEITDPVTLSIGIANFGGEADLTIDTLFKRADQALYAAKEYGRNCVKVWQAADSA